MSKRKVFLDRSLSGVGWEDIIVWNKLPRALVESPSLEGLKTCLDEILRGMV